MKKLLIVLFIGANTLAFAQKDTIYYNADWEEVTEYYADYYRPLPLEKKGKFWLIEDYFMDGTLQFVGHTIYENKEIFHGDVVWYYSNGRIQEKVRFSNGAVIGNFVVAPTESIKSRVGYTEEELVYEADTKEAAVPADAVKPGVERAADADDTAGEYSVDDFPLLKEGLPPIAFIQKGKRQELLKPDQTIILEKEPFTITFPGLAYNEENTAYHATQIAVVTNHDILDDINVGMRIADTTPFAPASGMAMDAHPHYLIIDANAHNYLYYKESGDGRLELQEKLEEDILLLKYTVNELVLNGTAYSILDFPHTDNLLYLVVFIDKNKNERIESGEVHKVEIRFE